MFRVYGHMRSFDVTNIFYAYDACHRVLLAMNCDKDNIQTSNEVAELFSSILVRFKALLRLAFSDLAHNVRILFFVASREGFKQEPTFWDGKSARAC